MPRQRGWAVTAAAILSFIFGAIGIVGGTVVMLSSIIFASFIATPIIGDVAKIDFWITALIGIILLASTVLNIIAGYLLWRRRRSGGYLTIILAAIQLVTSIVMLFLPGLWVGGIIGVVTSVILIVFVAVGWSSLGQAAYYPW